MKRYLACLLCLLPMVGFAGTLTVNIDNRTGGKVYYYQVEPNPVGTLSQAPNCESNEANHLCLMPGKSVIELKPADGSMLEDLVFWTVRKTGSGAAHLIVDSSGHDCFAQEQGLHTICLISHNGHSMQSTIAQDDLTWDLDSDKTLDITITK